MVAIRIGTADIVKNPNSVLASIITTQLSHPKAAMRKGLFFSHFHVDALHQIKEHLTNLEKREQTLESWSILLPGLISKVCDSEPWIRSFCIGLVSSRLLFQENTV